MRHNFAPQRRQVEPLDPAGNDRMDIVQGRVQHLADQLMDPHTGTTRRFCEVLFHAASMSPYDYPKRPLAVL